MKISLKELTENIKKADKAKIAVVAGAVGIALIMLSYFMPSGNKNNIQSDENISSTDKYVTETEQRLENILSDMLGGTKVNVMLTIENGVRYVYASETKNDKDISEDKTSQKTQHSDSEQNNYIIIKDDNGNEQALVETEIAPTVKGCVVVCDCGDAASVSGAVKKAVSATLGISEDKICVIGRYK